MVNALLVAIIIIMIIVIMKPLCLEWDFPGASDLKNLPAVQETWV